MRTISRARKWLEKKTKRGMRGFPLATIAFYGPDNRRASKVAVGIIPTADAEADELRRWFDETGDLRTNDAILTEIVDFLREHEVHSVAMPDRLIGCPHEEGIDYPDGESCPLCHYWKGRDRWKGVLDPD